MARKGKILVVDDEKDLVATLKQFLGEEGYDVLTALDGEGAIKILDREKPKLVVLDIRMPGINGIEVLKLIKNKYQNIKVIILSAYANDAENKAAIEKIGTDGFLAKPFSMAVLANTVLELLEGRKAVIEEGIKIKKQIPKAKILFIECGTMIANMLKDYFSNPNTAGGEYEMAFTTNKDETEKHLNSFKPDIVLMNYSTVKDIKIINMVLGSPNKPKETLIWGFDIDSLEKVANQVKRTAIQHVLVKEE